LYSSELDLFRNEKAKKFDISIDGGITVETAPKVIENGADIVVMGSAFYGTPIDKRKDLVRRVKSL